MLLFDDFLRILFLRFVFRYKYPNRNERIIQWYFFLKNYLVSLTFMLCLMFFIWIHLFCYHVSNLKYFTFFFVQENLLYIKKHQHQDPDPDEIVIEKIQKQKKTIKILTLNLMIHYKKKKKRNRNFNRCHPKLNHSFKVGYFIADENYEDKDSKETRKWWKLDTLGYRRPPLRLPNSKEIS